MFEWHKAKPGASLASQVLSQLPKYIHNLIDAQQKAKNVTATSVNICTEKIHVS